MSAALIFAPAAGKSLIVLRAEDGLPAGWTTASPRDEIRPRFTFDRTGGASGQGALVIAAGDSVGDHGWLQKSFPVTGGQFYRFSAQRRVQDVEVPRRSAIVRIAWQDAAGKPVRADVPKGREHEAGPIPWAEPEHPLDKFTDASGWTEVAGVYRAPTKAAQAIVELHLQWSPKGRVAWSDARFEETSPPPSRKVRLAAVHHRPSAEIERGEPNAAGQLLPLVYDELRRLAAARLAQEKPGQTLEATALVHEAYLRLVDVNEAQRFNNRGHFYAAAAEAMRRLLIESARRKKSAKRGGDLARQDLDAVEVAALESPGDVLALDEALQKLAAIDKPAADVVHLRFFAGLPLAEVARLLDVSPRTADRLWAYARAWLHQEMQGVALSDPPGERTG